VARMVGLVAALLILPVLGCSTEPEDSLAHIDSFEAWCRMAPPASQSAVDSAAVRDDLVGIWDDFLVSESLKVLGGGPDGVAPGDDPLLQELRDIGMMGAWAEGGTLWFGTGLMLPPILYPELETGSPEHFQALFRDYLDHAVASDRPSDPDELGAICMWTAIPAFFDRWVLVDGEGGLEIPMPREID
jgi:hypothetical protein